ncbi:MAG: chemotaxis protein CheW [Holophagales bacterium]|jgi:purine-binding chemotaxis protein CheW|nr:chemotaxis protein CheW [Holophagales bacterium]
MSAIGQAPTAKEGEAAAASESSVKQYMSFVVEGHSYAIPLCDVAEITPYRELNHMPHMPKNVVGLLDLRGVVLPVITLRMRMGLPLKESHAGDMILLLAHQNSRIGVLVDQVESVITATEEQHGQISPLLEGDNGKWINAILLLGEKGERVILVLEPSALLQMPPEEDPRDDGSGTEHGGGVDTSEIERKMDEGLRELIAMAGTREDGKIVPILDAVIGHNESEVTKVLDRVEKMLSSTDSAALGVSKFKQEVAMCGINAFDGVITELEKSVQGLQTTIFEVFDQLQFQDIVRQKLEKVLHHILGMQGVISDGFTSGQAAS